MTLAPWRSPLARALHRNRSLVYSRYVQLATVQLDGRPANRTVVFRGFLDDSNQLKFITDSRSEKVPQIQAHPCGEVCWYFPKTREQFRLLGQLTLVTDEVTEENLAKARQRQWVELSDAARLQFAWPPSRQERLTQSAAPEEIPDDPFSPPSPDPIAPLPNFCLLLLDPTQVDHLELRGDPQNRYVYYHSEGEWQVREVNP